MSDALNKLIEAVGAAEWTVTHWRDFSAVPEVDPDNPGPVLAHRAYHGSLDAAKALHEALLPGWDWSVGAGPIRGSDGCAHVMGWQKGENEGEADNPARAWLLAILRASAAQQEPTP